MPCILMIAGKDFDIPQFLNVTRLRVLKKMIKGEPRSSLRPDGEKLPYSYLTIETSKADYGDLNAQVKDTIKYLRKHRNQLMNIKTTGGIDHINLDFGIESSNGQLLQSIFMPRDLVSLAAEFRMSIQVSVYSKDLDSVLSESIKLDNGLL
ncbi:hypothetical protein [Chitinophaga solisilvae]|uniref:hypothetical protein n=1 Tax=Chitinophaga solisilvae TaxID=1233460 RepID=UPI0013691538|nr:hypothetical protein [Chitinophaga solisilvae]